MIKIEGLTKTYGQHTVVDNLSFNCSFGEVLGFLGPNGAGKSTTMKMITGFVTPTSGQISVCGFDVAEQSVDVRKRLGYLPEGAVDCIRSNIAPTLKLADFCRCGNS